jgi:plastocyanin
MRASALAALLGTLGLGAGVLIGCFSERDATAPPVEGQCTIPLEGSVPGSIIVVIRDFTFQPVALRVRAGDRVTWINCDVDAHTSSADGSQWTSPLLAPGDAFTQSFPAPGEFGYHCDPHPFMTGRVTVE